MCFFFVYLSTDDAIYEMEYVGLISNVLSKVCKRYNKYMVGIFTNFAFFNVLVMVVVLVVVVVIPCLKSVCFSI